MAATILTGRSVNMHRYKVTIIDRYIGTGKILDQCERSAVSAAEAIAATMRIQESFNPLIVGREFDVIVKRVS